MLQIPRYVLEKLRCSACGGYLNTKPLMVRADDQQQMCGKCYRLLPAEEKEKYARQAGLESVAEIIQFPCRYNSQGCGYRYTWCDEKDHEANCPYRSLITFPSDGSVNKSNRVSNELFCESDQIRASLYYEIKDRTYTNETKTFDYTMKLKGNCDKMLCIKNTNNSDELNDIEINLNGTLLIGNKPELVFSNITVKPIQYTNLYESITEYDRRCYHCTDSCDTCNQKDSKSLCKNYSKGCKETLQFDNAHRHEINCEYNDYKCILEPCNLITSLPLIKQHIKTDHPDAILSNEANKTFGNKDETFVIYSYGNIFKCFYYYFKTFVEFHVMLVGSSDEASNYSFEVKVNLDSGVVSKKSKCSTWNDAMLEKGVTFDKKELLGDNEKKLNSRSASDFHNIIPLETNGSESRSIF
ncbi:unnamed protein product [Phyllotreta striolata]|uniref:SIAH-type domain-containing protein n=1 Tax=Phyllotreta striolata TaxID=444603 RepID=A0A9N9XUJ7_PHYSR|nr:unnamed protein product [Phyllotreta striolata]